MNMYSDFNRPDLIDYNKLTKSNALYNLNNAFHVAEDKLALVPLLDAEGTSKLSSQTISNNVVLNVHVSFCVWALSCERMNIFEFTFNKVCDQSNYTSFRCQRWLSWWEVNHDVRRHILSLLLKDEGRICAGKKSWKGLLKITLKYINDIFLLYCCVNLKNGVKLPFGTVPLSNILEAW